MDGAFEDWILDGMYKTHEFGERVTQRNFFYKIQSPRRIPPKLSYETVHSIGLIEAQSFVPRGFIEIFFHRIQSSEISLLFVLFREGLSVGWADTKGRGHRNA